MYLIEGCNPCYYGKHIQYSYEQERIGKGCNPCYYGKHIQ